MKGEPRRISGLGPEHMINGGAHTGESAGEAGAVWGLEIGGSTVTTASL